MNVQLHRVLRSPVLIALVALALRLGVMGYKHTYEFSPWRDHFTFGYEMGRIARSIALGHGFSSPYHVPTGPTALVPPVYPYLLAGVFKLFGFYTVTSALVILSLNSVFSALTCVTIFFIGQKTFGPTVGVWAAWTWALFPDAWFWSTKWIWETTLSALLLSLVFLLTLHLERSTRTTAWLGLGLLWGIAALTNPALLSFLPISLGWIWYRQRQQGMRCARQIGVAALACVFSLTPWLMRNYLTFGHFIFIRDGFGLQLYLGNWEGSYPARDDYEMERYRRLGELAYMAEKQHEALHFIAGHPGTFTSLTLKRFVSFWAGTWQLTYINWFPGQFIVAKFAFYTSVSVLAFLGLYLAVGNRKAEALPFAILLVVFPATYYLTQVNSRYRHSIEPEMVVLAVYAAASIPPRLRCKLRGAKVGLGFLL
jgi:4-amino-4-deoxy-L-arabinose transferase-like glycosyltransferase